MLRAGWHGWRACFAWGLAVIAISVGFRFAFPQDLAHPLANSAITAPVLAFEFARNAADLDAVFGSIGDPLRPARIAGYWAGNLLDYAYMVAYGSFLFAFYRGSFPAEGPRWWHAAAWLGPIAAVSDAVENAVLLSLGADPIDPAARLALLAWPVWIKFGLLALASGAAAVTFWSRKHWLAAVACVPAVLLALPAIVRPHEFGQWLAVAIGISWAAILLCAARASFSPRRITQPN